LLVALPQSTRGQKSDDIMHVLISDLEEKGTYPDAPYILAHPLLTPEIAKLIENAGKHWVGQLEGRCFIQWEGPWRRLEQVAAKLRQESPQGFRAVLVSCTDGTSKMVRIFSRTVRLDHYGRKRIVIMHETTDLIDTPVFLFTDALFWEGHRIAQLWQYRWEKRMFL